MLAILFAHAHPERVTALLLSGVPPWDMLIDRRHADYQSASPSERAALDSLEARVLFKASDYVERDSAWIANESGAPPDDILSRRLGDASLLPLEIALQSLFSAPGLEDLRIIQTPVLIVEGGQPDPRGSGAVALARALPNAELVLVQGTGHDPWLDDPEQFFAAVRTFISSRP